MGTKADEARDFVKKKLLSTKRDGIKDLVAYMEECGFFKAPCSGGNHLCCEGGLAVHTASVIQYAEKVGKALLTAEEFKEMKSSIILVAALHDLGKAGSWEEPYYVPNLVKSKRKIDGEYPMVPSTSKPYQINTELPYFDHSDLSVKEADLYIELTPDEYFAILFHDGLYGSRSYWLKGHETKLYFILHTADFWSAQFRETKFIEEETDGSSTETE